MTGFYGSRQSLDSLGGIRRRSWLSVESSDAQPRPDRPRSRTRCKDKRRSVLKPEKTFRGLCCGHNEVFRSGGLQRWHSRDIELGISDARHSAVRVNPWGSVVIADYEAAFFYSALSLSPKIEQLVIRRNQQLGVLIWDVALITARARTI